MAGNSSLTGEQKKQLRDAKKAQKENAQILKLRAKNQRRALKQSQKGLSREVRKQQKASKLGFTFRDLIHESLEGVGSRPSRLFITLFGTVLGIASLVATLGFAQTTAGQIAKNFDMLSATRVTIEPGKTDGPGNKERATNIIPWDAVSRVQQLVGVEEASLYSAVPNDPVVKAVEIQDPSIAAMASPPVIAGSPEMADVVGAHIQTGRFFDSGHYDRKDKVVVLGSAAAEKLGVNRVTGQPAIFISGEPYLVIGIIDEAGTRKNLLNSVIVPASTAQAYLGLNSIEALDILIDVGAGSVVGRQAPIALNPNSPDGYKVKAPAELSQLQGQVEGDINFLFLAIGLVALLAGGVGIANVTLLSVSERRGEIGLRRALGAKTKQIGQQFMLESLTTGLLGGLIGVALGLFAIVIICLFKQWTPVVAPWIPVAGAGLGALVGLIAGSYPAIKAARIEPVDALRSA